MESSLKDFRSSSNKKLNLNNRIKLDVLFNLPINGIEWHRTTRDMVETQAK